MTTHTRPGQSGFSLIELMIAMVVTGIVSLSIYALMAQSQGAFQRQPALTDRQQNARIAIDLIEGDIANAGRGLPLVAQAFTDALDAPPGSPDELEIVLADTSCPSQLVCTGNDGVSVPALGNVGFAGTYQTRESVGAPPTCLNPAAGTRPLILLADGLNFSVHRSTAAGPGAACPGGGVPGNNGSVTLGPALLGVGPVPGPWPIVGPAPSAVTMYVAHVVRYRLADTNGDGFLSLERNESGLDALGVWQIVARGIDDLQVQYQTGVPGPLPDGWRDTPGVIAACVAPPPLPGGCTAVDYDAAVRNVRVTISARTADDRVMGAGPGQEFRGQLTTIATPRAVVAALEVATKALPAYPVFN